jgi:hypothetical protein
MGGPDLAGEGGAMGGPDLPLCSRPCLQGRAGVGSLFAPTDDSTP